VQSNGFITEDIGGRISICDNDRFICLDTIPACDRPDGQTDSQSLHNGKDRAIQSSFLKQSYVRFITVGFRP